MAGDLSKGSVTFRAWGLSLGLHIALLTVFMFTGFSQAPEKPSPARTSKVTVAEITRVMQTSPVRPKPKIKNTPRPFRIDYDKPIDFPSRAKLEFAADAGDRLNLPDAGAVSMLPGGSVLPAVSGFFGHVTDERKICYAVDCSGSMHGRFGMVRQELKDSIAGLEADRYFHIIFFLEGDKLLESGGGKLTRATEKAKSAAFDFIDSARPSGQTNAKNALKRAMQIRDDSGDGPGMIYFLTDGFDLAGPGAAGFAAVIENLRKELAPSARINTIGFWAHPTDCMILQAVARQSGGRFINIER